MKSFFAFILTLTFSLHASATLITVNSTEYNVEWTIGTFNDVNTTYDLINQVWWSDSNLAFDFASALGFVSDGDINANIGPSFAYDLINDAVYIAAAQDSVQAPLASLLLNISQNPDYEIAWAYVVNEDRESIPEPTSLLLLLIGACGLLLSRNKSHT